jgi:hypothetical protein
MTDDPREILRAAGVECPELGEYVDEPGDWLTHFSGEEEEIVNRDTADAVILALARSAAKYKWQRDTWMRENSSEYATERYWDAEVAALDARWEARHDA